MALADMVWTPPTTDAAKSAPGRAEEDRPLDGMDGVIEPVVIVGAAGRYIGS